MAIGDNTWPLERGFKLKNDKLIIATPKFDVPLYIKGKAPLEPAHVKNNDNNDNKTENFGIA